MYIHIDYSSGEPICRQVVSQIKLLLVTGEIKPGDRLPSIRELSKELRINPTTVSRIYTELSHQGVVTLRQGQGVFASGDGPHLANDEIRRRVCEHARDLLVEGLHDGLNFIDIKEILEQEYQKIKGDGG